MAGDLIFAQYETLFVSVVPITRFFEYGQDPGANFVHAVSHCYQLGHGKLISDCMRLPSGDDVVNDLAIAHPVTMAACGTAGLDELRLTLDYRKRVRTLTNPNTISFAAHEARNTSIMAIENAIADGAQAALNIDGEAPARPPTRLRRADRALDGSTAPGEPLQITFRSALRRQWTIRTVHNHLADDFAHAAAVARNMVPGVEGVDAFPDADPFFDVFLGMRNGGPWLDGIEPDEVGWQPEEMGAGGPWPDGFEPGNVGHQAEDLEHGYPGPDVD